MRTASRLTYALTISLLGAGPLLAGCFGDSSLKGPALDGPPFSADLVDLREPAKPPTRIFLGDGKVRLQSGDPTSSGALVLDPSHGTMLLIDDQHRSYIDAGMFASVAAKGFAPLLRFIRPAGAGDPCAEWNATVGHYRTFMRHDESGPPPHFTCRSLGEEKVNGRAATKWAVATDGAEPDTSTIWIDEKLHIVSRSVDHDGGMEMRNVHEGPQSASLFTPPRGYRKVSMTSILKGMVSGSGASSTPSTPSP